MFATFFFCSVQGPTCDLDPKLCLPIVYVVLGGLDSNSIHHGNYALSKIFFYSTATKKVGTANKKIKHMFIVKWDKVKKHAADCQRRAGRGGCTQGTDVLADIMRTDSYQGVPQGVYAQF